MKKLLTAVSILLCAVQMNAQIAKSQQNFPVNGKFEIQELPYKTDALEPVISQETMEYHYGKHYSGYLNKLNSLIQGTKFQEMSLEEIVKNSEGTTFDNAGQALNHRLYFWQFKSPVENNRPIGKLRKAIDRQFGSYDEFIAEFDKVSGGLFGSGWVFVSSDSNGKLYITKESNGGNAITKGLRPVLAFDLWEHAYYLDYHNLRAKHLQALWSIIDWEVAEERYTAKK